MKYREEFIADLERFRMKVELDPQTFKKLKDYHTHGLPCDLNTKSAISMHKIICKWISECGKQSVEFMSLMKAAVGVEYDTKEIKEIYKKSGEIPPAYDLSLRAICTNEDVLKIMNDFLYNGILPNEFRNSRRFRERVKKRAEYYVNHISRKKVGRLTNGSSTRIKNRYNTCDIVGVVYMTKGYEKFIPRNILNRLNVIRKPYWDYLEFEPQFENTFGRHFNVPGKEGKILREVYNMDPVLQLDSSAIADYLRYIAKGIDTNATLDQYKWIRKCIRNNWNSTAFIISTDMDKYSDSLNRDKLVLILYQLGIIEKEEIDELKLLWSLDVWDEDLNIPLRNSDSVKQGQYSIFDAMTIINMFLQEIVYDILGEDSETQDIETGEIVSKNSALGDDTVLAFLNEYSNGLDIIQDVFGYMGVKISRSKTHIMNRGYDYKGNTKTNEYGFVDFAKRVINKDGMLPYISINAISKNNFDDYVMEYFRILEEDEELAEQFGKQFLKDRFVFIKNLHKINGGRRVDEITDDDMILFEYKTNLIRSLGQFSPHEIYKQLMYIKDQDIFLSNTPLVGWLDDYDGDDMYFANEDDDQKIIAKIMNYHTTGIDIDFVPSDYIGKTWDEVKEDEVFNNILMTMRVDEKNKMSRRRVSHVYDKLSKLKLSEYRHNLFIFESSVTNDHGYRDYTDMRVEAFTKKMHISFKRVCRMLGYQVYEDRVWYWNNRYVLIYKGVEYRLYHLQSPRYNSRKLITRDVFKDICKDIYVNKDMDIIYDLFMDSLPYPSRDEEYYCYFDE